MYNSHSKYFFELFSKKDKCTHFFLYIYCQLFIMLSILFFLVFNHKHIKMLDYLIEMFKPKKANTIEKQGDIMKVKTKKQNNLSENSPVENKKTVVQIMSSQIRIHEHTGLPISDPIPIPIRKYKGLTF